MSVILIRLPNINILPNGRPDSCPYCGGQILQRWGRVTKPVKDKQDMTAVIYRYRCQSCERTFRDYPEDIDRSSHARGLRRLAAVLWALGLSYREIIRMLEDNEINLSRTTVWREGQEVTAQLDGKRINKLRQEYRIDKSYVHKVSNNFGLVLAVDLSDGDYIIVGTLNENNPSFVTSWLKPLVRDTNIEITQFGTDRLDHIYV
jgi:DNA-directed RNA polymerase subunit RPC12/RpoP